MIVLHFVKITMKDIYNSEAKCPKQRSQQQMQMSSELLSNLSVRRKTALSLLVSACRVIIICSCHFLYWHLILSLLQIVHFDNLFYSRLFFLVLITDHTICKFDACREIWNYLKVSKDKNAIHTTGKKWATECKEYQIRMHRPQIRWMVCKRDVARSAHEPCSCCFSWV